MKTGKCDTCPTVGKLKEDVAHGVHRGWLCSRCYKVVEVCGGDERILRRMVDFLQKYERVGPVEDNRWKIREKPVGRPH